LTSYAGRHAELYDVFYAAKDYAAEAAFVHGCLARHARGGCRSILDLACGTGRHALELHRLGHEVCGVDHSPAMLRIARERAAAAGAPVRFEAGELAALAPPGAPFDAAVCLFDSIGYVQTNEGVGRALAGMHRAVREDGLLVLEFWHAAAMLTAHEPVRVRRFRHGPAEILRISETRLDVARQLATVTYTVYEHREDGRYTRFTETQTNRYFLVQEMAGWLARAGFAPLEFLDGFSLGAVTERTWHVVGVARREAGDAPCA
jgi:SAM-dependent methyltransferase